MAARQWFRNLATHLLCWRVVLSREAMLRKLHLRDEYYRRRARDSFAEFIRHTKPDYQLSWFHEELARWINSSMTYLRSARRA